MKLPLSLLFIVLTSVGVSAFAGDAVPPAAPSLVDQVVKMADVGVSDKTILNYLDNSGGFALTAEDVITLHQRGISETVITAMLQHSAQMQPSAPAVATIVMRLTGPNAPIIYPTPAREAVPLLSDPLVVYSSPYAYGQSSVMILGGSYYSGSHCYGGSRYCGLQGYGGFSAYGARSGGYGCASFGRCR
jgi:hypothetical protein